MPWLLAGLWSEWVDLATGEVVPNFTLITTNCDGHPLLARLHRPEVHKVTGLVLPAEQQDKRSLVHVNPTDLDAWLHGNDETARRLAGAAACGSVRPHRCESD